MQIRAKLLASHVTMALVVTTIAVTMIAIVRIGEADQRELRSSYEQLQAINFIAASANDYAEQVAELYILGTDPSEIEEARDELTEALDRKMRLVEEELGYLADAEEIAREQTELDRIEAMRETLLELERVRRGVPPLLSEGRRAEAEILYRDRIEHGFDSVIGALIETATENERDEVTGAITNSEILSDRLRLLAFGLVGTAGLLALVNAVVVHHAISRPITALAAGADAVGRGDLAHRVDLDRNDEFGRLAARFNVMTAQIRDQRDRLMDANEVLEGQVAARTRELRARGDELERAVTRLSELAANRAQFFADISHELRTPLTILRGTAEVALRTPDSPPERLREALSRVVQKADQMGRLVEDLLFLARSEVGAITVDRKPVDLQEVFGDVLIDSHGLSRRAGVTISPRQPPEPVVVTGDADRLRQAILIPLDNAVRVAPAGTNVWLELSSASDWATVTVRDKGPGFTPDEAQRAFIRFFRGGAGRGRTGRGAGLGLSIARWIVEQHGGTIGIESEPGNGATVRIDLPLAGGAA